MPLQSPEADREARIAKLEAVCGPLPISLRAFYEIVGAVDLRGWFPILDSEDPPGPETLDPLCVWSLIEAIDSYAAPEEGDGFSRITIRSDPLVSMGYSGVGNMETALPCPAMDAYVWLERPWHAEGNLFVVGLRRAFANGGFNQYSDPRDSDLGKDAVDYLRSRQTEHGETYFDFLTRDLLTL